MSVSLTNKAKLIRSYLKARSEPPAREAAGMPQVEQESGPYVQALEEGVRGGQRGGEQRPRQSAADWLQHKG